jgi:uroporphyrin-III C-methyltransferase
MTKTGKVYLVGAGPGHPDLLTIRAAELLKTAEVIVYDRLIQDEVLALAKPTAEKIFMGKPLGRHCSRQDEIHDLLVRKAREGKTVVRLKGGDPFLFGRGGEEAEYLAEHGIPFEVVPGVSSCLSAPLSAGIAVTHRDRASSVAIVTGHQASEHEDRVDWQALSKVDTLVVLMGIHNIEHITRKLMAAGLSPDTPAAIIQMAFWESECVVVSTLGAMAKDIRRAAIEPPATLVIGEAVRLREKLKHHQRHIGQHASRDSLIYPVPVPIPIPIADRPSGETISPDPLSLEEESCVGPALSEKEVLQ